MKKPIAEMIEQLSTNDHEQFLKLLALLEQEEQGEASNECLVVYQGNQARYHGDSTRAALSVFTPLFSQAVDQLKRMDNSVNELVFFCIHADHSVDILGEVYQ